jgi:hypothetical protein
MLNTICSPTYELNFDENTLNFRKSTSKLLKCPIRFPLRVLMLRYGMWWVENQFWLLSPVILFCGYSFSKIKSKRPMKQWQKQFPARFKRLSQSQAYIRVYTLIRVLKQHAASRESTKLSRHSVGTCGLRAMERIVSEEECNCNKCPVIDNTITIIKCLLVINNTISFTIFLALFFSRGSTVLYDPVRLTDRRFLELFRHMIGLLGRVISPSQGLYLHRTTQHRQTRTNIRTLSGIRTHDQSNQPAKTHSSDRTTTVTGILSIILHDKFKLKSLTIS